jgi:hypothetical protein
LGHQWRHPGRTANQAERRNANQKEPHVTWFKVDDGFHSHPKTAAASLAAIGLWTVAGAWCGNHLTDGNIPHRIAEQLSRGAVELADELVDCGLWRRTRSGYRFHDWPTYQPSSKAVKQIRALRAEAGRKGGLASGKARSKNEANASARASPGLEPPTRPLASKEAKRVGRPSASRNGTAADPKTEPPPPNGRLTGSPNYDEIERAAAHGQRRAELAAAARAAAHRKQPPQEP